MFGLGVGEILLILALALIFIGPERLPDLARSLAKGYAEFRRSFDEVKTTIEKDIRAIDAEKLLRDGKGFPLDEVKNAPWAQDGKLTPPASAPVALENPAPDYEAPAPDPYAGANGAAARPEDRDAAGKDGAAS